MDRDVELQETVLLAGISRDLETQWPKVVKSLPKGERDSIPSKPDIRTFGRLFNQARDKLNAKSSTRSGKIKSWFVGVAETINSHKYLLKLLPEGDKYTSVLVGSFTVLIQVAVTYSDTAENVSECLERLSSQVSLLKNALGANPRRQYIRWQVSKFYCHLFRFLVLILTEWLSSSSKRFFNSFGDGLLSACDTAVRKMTACKDDIMHSIILIQQSTIDDMNAKLDRLGSLVQASLVGAAVDRSRLCDAPRVSSLTEVAPFKALPQSQNTDAKSGSKEDGGKEKVEPQLLEDELSDESNPWTSETMQESLKHLETFHQAAYVASLTSPLRQVYVSAEMRANLVRMVSSRRSAALWIEGPDDDEPPSHATLLAAQMVHDLSQLNIPSLCHFIHRPKGTSLDRERALLEMVYSLVYQISRALPEHAHFEAGVVEKVKLLPAVPQTRSEVTRSLAPAVNLLESMLENLPPLLFCVVDGFQLLVRQSDSPEMKAATKQFVACICEAATRQLKDQPSIFKSLWTTAGPCRDLQQARRSRALAYLGYEDDEEFESMALRGREMSPLTQ
ncbi:phytanoyl-dioxygenase family protein [Colletotrichum scovillei]|uniref:Phytanoyl-dioxygenase family protein n=1 Tax=Colletotrichum scovillei TaxID=1209932 RepID=A0A9P7R3S6_9PEZI|nr:phytanoyl-dioxygenase family protein [Colletotrichum scovillei]KAG7056884.1 phytanoyl-dioxygenase family protein [Colletotrichum scovillei]KAG7066811.1 phytanoyl-dioxygenase family protein [Colletotrichum scovillei]